MITLTPLPQPCWSAHAPGSPSVDLLMRVHGQHLPQPTAEGVLHACAQRAGLQRRIAVGRPAPWLSCRRRPTSAPAAARRGAASDLRACARSSRRATSSAFDLVLVMDEEPMSRPPGVPGSPMPGACTAHAVLPAPQVTPCPIPGGGAGAFEQVLDLVGGRLRRPASPRCRRVSPDGTMCPHECRCPRRPAGLSASPTRPTASRWLYRQPVA